MYIIGSLSTAPSKVRFLLILTDYFSNQAGPYQKIDEREVVDFFYENIICRSGIPKEIACDNGPQFIGIKVKKFFEDLKIKRIASLPYRMSVNGQEELINNMIIQSLKKRLEATKGK